MCSIGGTPTPMNVFVNSSKNSICSCNSDSPKDEKKYLLPEEPRKNWEKWDLRILVLYILVTQLSLHLLGRHRKVSSHRILISLSVWLLYLFSDLFATVALGKLSKISITKQGSNGGQKELEFTKRNGGIDHPSNAYNDTIDPVSLLRGLWAPIILFYLGGPDSLTVLKMEENEMWTRHLVGLVAQGLRTAYVLFVTFAKSSGLSILALLMIVPGIVKYGERVWVMKSLARGKYEGFVELDEYSPSARQGKGNNNSEERDLVLKAFSNFKTLKPHLPGYECDDKSKLESLIKDFHARIRSSTDHAAAANNFKLIEIELGFMYDVRFSKVGTIFTVWGCILRLLTFSCIVGVFVAFFLIKKPGGERLKVDLPITVMLLVGAIFLEVAGVIDQLVSDWAVAWAFKYRNILSGTPVFALPEFVLSKRKRWSGLMGQFSLLDFCNKYNSPTKLHQMIESVCGKEKIWDLKFGLPLSEVDDTLKKLIIHQIIETLPSLSDIETLQTSGMKRGERSLEKCQCQDQFEWSIKLEFTESILVWHVATDICYHSQDPNSVTGDQRAARMLSYYMMHLLLICPPKLPFCKTNDKCFQENKCFRDDLKINFVLGPKLRNAEARKQLVEEKQTDSNTVKHIKKLARDLIEKENKWKIMSFVWVEMLCYAASHCPVKNHVQELRHGGEFLTHVWLLLMHYGVNKELEQDRTDKLQPMGEKAAEKFNESIAEFPET